ncbi:Fe(3+)-hydroxamate ABC transporter permease FhuB [Pectobacterium cacticida]|uniref:Fe(3+)-hydroxamate ABC transporter permease FhuB n=1 Tax=Pectobacterium cacticida TaxID=69221 RepID=UPI0039882046
MVTKKQYYLYLSLFLLALPAIGINSALYFFNDIPLMPFDTADQVIADIILWNSTIPRIVMAILVGGSLGLSTLLLQQITHNPLASESTLAISSGAQLALLTVSIFYPVVFLTTGSEVWSISGAVLTLILVLFLSLDKGLSPLRTLLAGMVVSLFFGAIASVLMIFYPEESKAVLKWGAGSLIQDGWHDVIELLITNAAAFAGLFFLLKPLQMLDLDDAQASSLGVSVKRIRLFSLLIVTGLVAISVSLVGMISFIGLTAATIVRQCELKTMKERIIATYILGGLLLLLTDTLLTLIAKYTTTYFPVGTATAFLGAPILVYVLFKSFKQKTIDQPVKTVKKNISRLEKIQLFGYLIVLLLFLLIVNLFVKHDMTGYVISRWDQQLLELRLQRVMTAFASGLLLSICGLILQRVAKNPLASPELMGVNSGAAIMILGAMLLTPLPADHAWIAGIFGAALTLSFIVFINYRHQFQPEKVLITGLAVAALMDALMRLFLTNGDPRVQFLLVWLSGSTYYSTSSTIYLALGVSFAALIITFLLHRVLTLLSLAPAVSQSLGLPIFGSRLMMLSIAAVLSAISTLLIGPLSFIGLISPHLARVLGCHSVKTQLPCACMIGINMMLMADFFSRNLLFPYEIPTSLVATVIGGGCFLILMKKV